MDYEVQIEELPEQPYVALAIECSPADFTLSVEQALTDVWAVLDEAGVPPVGPPLCIVPQITDFESNVPPDAPWQLIAGFPVEEELEADDPIKAGKLPGGRVATVVHKGKLDTLSTTYLALQVYLQAEGLTPNGVPWEEYVTDPVWEPEPEKWRTYVRWAVQ